jgi:hypothetical protein
MVGLHDDDWWLLRFGLDAVDYREQVPVHVAQLLDVGLLVFPQPRLKSNWFERDA